MAGAKPWGGRFGEDTDPAVERFTASVHFDQALARYDILGSIAHARMLGHTGVIPAADAEAIVAGLEGIAREVEAGTLPLDPRLEDVHMNVEARLRERIGPVAGRLHTGRSRNDQVATDLALYLRDAARAARLGLVELRRVLVRRAREHVDTVLPGYTHLQRAQPVRLAHHWLAYVEMMGRDAGRFTDLRRRLSLSPLGASALAGTTLPLDREETARALGFEGPARNSLDAVASRDGALEFLAACAIAMVHLSRLAEELVLWSTSEFGFVELSDAYATGSSLMPQKKNPDVPELVRGKVGRVIGDFVALLTVVKGLPLAYNRDLQEDKEPVFDAARTLRDSLGVLAGAIDTLAVRAERMRAAADDPLLLATDLAEALVGEGVPFRDAHEVVGRIVADCLAAHRDLRALSRDALRAFHPAFPAGAAELLSLDAALERRATPGATSRARVLEALARAESDLAEEARALDAEKERDA
jgi:argininosuccinate lyase